MNLHAIAMGYVAAVNPLLAVIITPNQGYITLKDGSRVAAYGPPVSGWLGQVQSLTYQDIRQIEGMNIEGVRRGIYLNGRWPGVNRPFQSGGDLITFPQGTVYLSAYLLEDWNDTAGWCKVVATLQNIRPQTSVPDEQYVEVGSAPFYRMPLGQRYGQRMLIVDNLLRATSEEPIMIYGRFNSGGYYTFNTPGEAIEPYWDGDQWVLA